MVGLSFVFYVLVLILLSLELQAIQLVCDVACDFLEVFEGRRVTVDESDTAQTLLQGDFLLVSD